MSMRESAVEEKGKEQGEAERNHYILTSTHCATHHPTKRTEYNLWRQQEGGGVSGVQLSLGKGKEKCFNVCLLCFPIPKPATKYIKAIN